MSPDASREPGPRCRAEIDLAALRHNAAVCRDLAGPDCGIMAVVKADAYGHGLERVVMALGDLVDWLGVANYREAVRARKAAGADTPVLVLSPAAPDERYAIVAHGISASVSTTEEVAAYDAAAESLGTEAKLHAVADTGMGRMGASPDSFPALLAAIESSGSCRLEGVETHFPSADEDRGYTLGQIERFVRLLKESGVPENTKIHLGNSAGLIGYRHETGFASLTRPGLALYGISPLPEDPGLRPTLALKTIVTLVREIPEGTSVSYGRTFISDRPMRVATLGAGYGDGYPRHLSGKDADVLIGGTRCRLLGRVTMDQVVVDVSHLGDAVAPGDEAVLIGTQGEEMVSACEVAEKAGTIPWEILTGITGRVERVAVEVGKR